MSVNRFYNPSRGAYVSQFVPNELPADLLLKGILSRRQAEDKQQDMVGKLLDWDMEVRPGDLADKNAKKMEARKFADEMFGQELSSAENIRKYKNFVRGFQDDKNIPYWQKNLELTKEIEKQERDMKLKGGHDYDPAQWDDIRRNINHYDASGGFRGTGLTFEEMMGEKGMDYREEYEKLYNQLAGDSVTSSNRIKDLDYSLYAKYTKGGISKEKIKDATARQVYQAYDGALGRHFKRRYLAGVMEEFDPNGTISSERFLAAMTPEERDKIEEGMFKAFTKDVHDVGMTFVHKTVIDDSASARNTAFGYSREDAEKAGVPIVDTLAVVGSTTNLSWDKKLNSISEQKAAITNTIADIKANPHMYVDATAKPEVQKKQLADAIANAQGQLKSLNNQEAEIKTDQRNAYNSIKGQVLSAEDRKIEEEIKKLEKKIKAADKNLYLNNQPGDAFSNKNMELAGYQAQLTALKNKIQPKYNEVNSKWKNYLKGASKEVRQYKVTENLGGLPTMKGYETTLNSGAHGFSIQTVTNGVVSTLPQNNNEVEIIIDENNKRVVNSKSLTDFKVSGVMSGDFAGRGAALTGTANYVYYDEKTGKQIKKPIKVIVTQPKDATAINMFSVSSDLKKQANALEKTGNYVGAEVARSEALDLAHPETTRRLALIEKAPNGKTIYEAIPLDYKGSKATVKISKNNQGKYTYSIVENGNVIGGSQGKFVSYGDMKNDLVNLAVE
jgi:hypothetical protein